MKLIICPKCEDWVKLRLKKMRKCECGHIKGRYIDNVKAEVSEDAISVGVGNGSLREAHASLIDAKIFKENLDRKGYIKECFMLTWLRPNEGKGNPHTKIIKSKKPKK